MTGLTLLIANKNYSSWSFRAWLGLKAHNIAFEERLEPLDPDSLQSNFTTQSPSGKVPVLVDGSITVWESLAILEYVAEKYPDRKMWPALREERAVARAVAHEMHAGFLALRQACPMNMRRNPSRLEIDEDVQQDVERIERLWSDCLIASGGPFLFGSFCNADAMYAPVVNRFLIYQLSDHPAVRDYTEAMTALPAWNEWLEAAQRETWVIGDVEV